MRKGDVCHGFKVLDVMPVPDCNATGIHLRHVEKGMEVFHLLNDDAENLFAFAFRTPSKDSTGAAHVLEHSVLCGSERYPLKDPFIRLANQSVKTYLNAWTASDHTVFPASSQIEADYFNLMGVYADAVFFPLLRKEIFMQEGHRLEIGPDGNPCIQGVVFNEMKGSYSSFDSAAGDAIDRVLFEGTAYEFDSGGDPLVIPSLTLKALRAFHKKYYCTANCNVFLYGNIPTEKQLAFLAENVTSRVSSAGKAYRFPKKQRPLPVRPFVRAWGPAGAEGTDTEARGTAVVAWRVSCGGDDAVRFPLEMLFLGDLLWGDDSAPVAKALLASGLGEDLAPQTGEDIQGPIKTMAVGLRGLLPGKERAMRRVVMDALSRVAAEGIPRKDVERTCMRFSFSTREIRRFNGPYSLVLLRRCLRGWSYGEKPWATLRNQEAIERIVSDVRGNPGCLKALVTKMLLSNESRSLIVVTPSAAWTRKRSAKEAALAKSLAASLPPEKIDAMLSLMHSFQNAVPTKEEEARIPHLEVRNLSPDCADIRTGLSHAGGIPLFCNEIETNGILYADVAFPVDVLAPKDYLLLTTLASCLGEIGWSGKPWDEALSEIHSVTGGFGAYIRHAHVPEASEASPDRNRPWFGRDWLILHFKAMDSDAEKAFRLLSECLSKTDFRDTERLTDIVRSMHNNGIASVVPSATAYATMRSLCTRNRSAAVSEILEGLSSLYNEKRVCDAPAARTAASLRAVFSRIKAGGAVIHLTAGAAGLSAAKKCLPDFIRSLSLVPPEAPYEASDREFYALTRIPGRYRLRSSPSLAGGRETFAIPGTMGFAGASFPGARFDTKDCVADEVFCHCMETRDLWKAIRTEGGAYGVMLAPDSDCAMTRFATYRDPDPYRSLSVLKSFMASAGGRSFSPDEVEKAVLGCYSSEMEPRTPSGTGATGFLWRLYGLTNAQKKRRLSWLLKMRPGDLRRAALRYASAVTETRDVVLCAQSIYASKSAQTTGIIYKLPV